MTFGIIKTSGQMSTKLCTNLHNDEMCVSWFISRYDQTLLDMEIMVMEIEPTMLEMEIHQVDMKNEHPCYVHTLEAIFLFMESFTFYWQSNTENTFKNS